MINKDDLTITMDKHSNDSFHNIREMLRRSARWLTEYRVITDEPDTYTIMFTADRNTYYNVLVSSEQITGRAFIVKEIAGLDFFSEVSDHFRYFTDEKDFGKWLYKTIN